MKMNEAYKVEVDLIFWNAPTNSLEFIKKID